MYLAAEGASVGGVLGGLDLLHDLADGGTIAGAVLSGHTDLLRVARLNRKHKHTNEILAHAIVKRGGKIQITAARVGTESDSHHFLRATKILAKG
jgi:hypothetical protein